MSIKGIGSGFNYDKVNKDASNLKNKVIQLKKDIKQLVTESITKAKDGTPIKDSKLLYNELLDKNEPVMEKVKAFAYDLAQSTQNRRNRSKEGREYEKFKDCVKALYEVIVTLTTKIGEQDNSLKNGLINFRAQCTQDMVTFFLKNSELPSQHILADSESLKKKINHILGINWQDSSAYIQPGDTGSVNAENQHPQQQENPWNSISLTKNISTVNKKGDADKKNFYNYVLKDSHIKGLSVGQSSVGVAQAFIRRPSVSSSSGDFANSGFSRSMSAKSYNTEPIINPEKRTEPLLEEMDGFGDIETKNSELQSKLDGQNSQIESLTNQLAQLKHTLVSLDQTRPMKDKSLLVGVTVESEPELTTEQDLAKAILMSLINADNNKTIQNLANLNFNDPAINHHLKIKDLNFNRDDIVNLSEAIKIYNPKLAECTLKNIKDIATMQDLFSKLTIIKSNAGDNPVKIVDSMTLLKNTITKTLKDIPDEIKSKNKQTINLNIQFANLEVSKVEESLKVIFIDLSQGPFDEKKQKIESYKINITEIECETEEGKKFKETLLKRLNLLSSSISSSATEGAQEKTEKRNRDLKPQATGSQVKKSEPEVLEEKGLPNTDYFEAESKLLLTTPHKNYGTFSDPEEVRNSEKSTSKSLWKTSPKDLEAFLNEPDPSDADENIEYKVASGISQETSRTAEENGRQPTNVVLAEQGLDESGKKVEELRSELDANIIAERNKILKLDFTTSKNKIDVEDLVRNLVRDSDDDCPPSQVRTTPLSHVIEEFKNGESLKKTIEDYIFVLKGFNIQNVELNNLIQNLSDQDMAYLLKYIKIKNTREFTVDSIDKDHPAIKDIAHKLQDVITGSPARFLRPKLEENNSQLIVYDSKQNQGLGLLKSNIGLGFFGNSRGLYLPYGYLGGPGFFARPILNVFKMGGIAGFCNAAVPPRQADRVITPKGVNEKEEKIESSPEDSSDESEGHTSNDLSDEDLIFSPEKKKVGPAVIDPAITKRQTKLSSSENKSISQAQKDGKKETPNKVNEQENEAQKVPNVKATEKIVSTVIKEDSTKTVVAANEFNSEDLEFYKNNLVVTTGRGLAIKEILLSEFKKQLLDPKQEKVREENLRNLAKVLHNTVPNKDLRVELVKHVFDGLKLPQEQVYTIQYLTALPYVGTSREPVKSKKTKDEPQIDFVEELKKKNKSVKEEKKLKTPQEQVEALLIVENHEMLKSALKEYSNLKGIVLEIKKMIQISPETNVEESDKKEKLEKLKSLKTKIETIIEQNKTADEQLNEILAKNELDEDMFAAKLKDKSEDKLKEFSTKIVTKQTEIITQEISDKFNSFSPENKKIIENLIPKRKNMFAKEIPHDDDYIKNYLNENFGDIQDDLKQFIKENISKFNRLTSLKELTTKEINRRELVEYKNKLSELEKKEGISVIKEFINDLGDEKELVVPYKKFLEKKVNFHAETASEKINKNKLKALLAPGKFFGLLKDYFDINIKINKKKNCDTLKNELLDEDQKEIIRKLSNITTSKINNAKRELTESAKTTPAIPEQQNSQKSNLELFKQKINQKKDQTAQIRLKTLWKELGNILELSSDLITINLEKSSADKDVLIMGLCDILKINATSPPEIPSINLNELGDKDYMRELSFIKFKDIIRTTIIDDIKSQISTLDTEINELSRKKNKDLLEITREECSRKIETLKVLNQDPNKSDAQSKNIDISIKNLEDYVTTIQEHEKIASEYRKNEEIIKKGLPNLKNMAALSLLEKLQEFNAISELKPSINIAVKAMNYHEMSTNINLQEGRDPINIKNYVLGFFINLIPQDSGFEKINKNVNKLELTYIKDLLETQKPSELREIINSIVKLKASYQSFKKLSEEDQVIFSSNFSVEIGKLNEFEHIFTHEDLDLEKYAEFMTSFFKFIENKQWKDQLSVYIDHINDQQKNKKYISQSELKQSSEKIREKTQTKGKEAGESPTLNNPMPAKGARGPNLFAGGNPFAAGIAAGLNKNSSATQDSEKENKTPKENLNYINQTPKKPSFLAAISSRKGPLGNSTSEKDISKSLFNELKKRNDDIVPPG